MLIGKPSTNKTIENTSRKPIDTIGYHRNTWEFCRNGRAVQSNGKYIHYDRNNTRFGIIIVSFVYENEEKDINH